MKKLNIFISHHHGDAKIAKNLKRCIEIAFLEQPSIFLSEDLAPGTSWLQEICDFLAKEPVTIVVASRTAMTRPWVWFEVGASWLAGTGKWSRSKTGKRQRLLKKHAVIPVCCKGTIKSKLPDPLRYLTAVNLTKQGLRALLEEIADQSGCRLDESVAKTAIRQAFPAL